MTTLVVIGVDPGPIPGLCVLRYAGGALVEARALQCSANWIEALVKHEVDEAELAFLAAALNQQGNTDCRDLRTVPRGPILSVERYTPRRGRGRQLAAGANQQTQEMAAALPARYRDSKHVQVVSYTPSTVMTWATEQKLRKVGLWDSTTGCAHARAAAKHALYSACKDGGMPNPLSPRAALT